MVNKITLNKEHKDDSDLNKIKFNKDKSERLKTMELEREYMRKERERIVRERDDMKNKNERISFGIDSK